MENEQSCMIDCMVGSDQNGKNDLLASHGDTQVGSNTVYYSEELEFFFGAHMAHVLQYLHSYNLLMQLQDKGSKVLGDRLIHICVVRMSMCDHTAFHKVGIAYRSTCDYMDVCHNLYNVYT